MKQNTIKRLVKGLAILLGAAVVLVYIGLPVGMGIVTLLPAQAAVGQPPEGFSAVTLQAEDGVHLHAWYRPPAGGSTGAASSTGSPSAAGAAIILLHGAGDSREGLRSHAALLARHGYGVLAVDLRGHGESQGRTNRLGWQGTPDVGAAVAFLQAQPEVSAIGGLGLSMGGEALLGAAGQYPALRAIVADGATRRCTAELLALEAERPLVRNFTARVMYASVGLFSGQQPPSPLLDSMAQAGATRFLLIAAGQNRLESEFNRLFAATLPERAALWVAPAAGHIQALRVYPQEYEQRVTAFFDAALLGK